LPLSEARANRAPIEWKGYTPPQPECLGVRAYAPDLGRTPVSGVGASKIAITLGDLVEYIDWSPFFHAWELRGRYPGILDDPKIGKQARELFGDAQKLLEQIVAKNMLIPRGVHALWPANSIGDDVEVYTDETRAETLATFYFLRQQMQKPAAQFNHCLADSIASM